MDSFGPRSANRRHHQRLANATPRRGTHSYGDTMVHYDDTRPGKYIYFGVYIPPYLSPEEQKMLRNMGVGAPDRKLTSNSLTFTVPH